MPYQNYPPDLVLVDALNHLSHKALHPETGIQPLTGALLALIRAVIEFSAGDRSETSIRAAFDRTLLAAAPVEKDR